MRKSRIFLVITFSETADAMAAEKLLAGRQIPGRIIPIPRQLSAGCGLSWRTEPELEDQFPFTRQRKAVQPRNPPPLDAEQPVIVQSST